MLMRMRPCSRRPCQEPEAELDPLASGCCPAHTGTPGLGSHRRKSRACVDKLTEMPASLPTAHSHQLLLGGLFPPPAGVGDTRREPHVDRAFCSKSCPASGRSACIR